MKITQIIATAGLVVASLGVSAAADAQSYRGGYDRYHHDDRRWHDRGRHYGWDRHHQRCRVEWRHHHRVQVCR